ncbi:hypothetical protein EV174_003695 [Coemansia sp. RSA 2320]|nr:hypothetical protein EV174_003695 [Coemansia sp. RSA 2320]
MRSSLVSQLVALLKDDRSYSIELAPKVAHCRGELVDLIIDKGIAEYLQFKGVEHNYLIRNGVAERVPGSKEDVFASDSLSLIEKRKLMKLMTSITDDESHALLLDGCPEEMTFARFLESKFRLNAKLLDSVLYAVARAESKDELTARSGCERVRKYAKSIGRFGRMAYLCAMYGGGSEIAQSFCRLCAVAGGTYILSEEVRSIEKSWRDGADNGYCVQLAHGKVFAKHIILDPCYSPDSEPTTTAISRAMCILDYPVFGDDTTAILSYVDETEGAVVAMLYTTRATLAAPSGQSIVYAWKTGHLADTRSLLLRALTAARGTLARPLFTALFEVRDLRSSASGLSGLYHTAPPDATVDFDDTVDQARQLLSALL